MKFGIRGHDIQAVDIKDLCMRLKALHMNAIQFAPEKSFPKTALTVESVREMKQMLDYYGVHVAVYGCYVDPLTVEGEERFFRQMEYAAILNADVIGTETAVHQLLSNETEEKYQEIREVLFRWTEYAKSMKISVGIEAVTGFPIHSVEKTERLLTDLNTEYLKIIWDPANLIDERNAFRQREIFIDGLQRYGHRIVAAHYKDRPDISYESTIAYCRNRGIPVLLEGISEKEAAATAGSVAAIIDGRSRSKSTAVRMGNNVFLCGIAEQHSDT